MPVGYDKANRENAGRRAGRYGRCPAFSIPADRGPADKGAMNRNTLRVFHKKFIFTGIPNAEGLCYTYSSKVSKEKRFLIQSYS